MIRHLPKRLLMLTLLCAGLAGACGDEESEGGGSCNNNGVLDPGELCDGPSLNGATCLSLSMGRNDGTLSCGVDCKFVVAACNRAPGGSGGSGFGGTGSGGI